MRTVPVVHRQGRRRHLLVAAALALGVTGSRNALAYDCSSPDPAQWPAPARPYFMIAFDTSGSMNTSVGFDNSCNFVPTTWRGSHGRCAVNKTVMAFAGQANFGLSSFARTMSGCSATCYTGCTFANLPNNAAGTGCTNGCGPEPTPAATNSSSRAGANILVPMLRDIGQPPSNVGSLLSWVDGNCTGSVELFADGCTPLNGILRDMFRYYAGSWTRPGGGVTYASPLTSAAAGERACRSVNVILVTDGDETCDVAADAIVASAALYNGFTKDGIAWHVRTHVIDFGGGGGVTADRIADAGDDGNSTNGSASAYLATDEWSLANAFSNIISATIRPESCNNADDNCNGCTDEGYEHYCNVGKPCCAWSTALQRQACLTSYEASITSNPPTGDTNLLPCTTSAQQQDASRWLCYNPGERCDTLDNNCNGAVDEGQTRCGNPLHCPTAESCNGLDDDCDGQVDNGGVCGDCVPTAEICDGCDNDCDGIVDNGAQNVLLCGLPQPPNCLGQRTCLPPQPAPVRGGCLPNRGYGPCTNSPAVEDCNGMDDDCDAVADNHLPVGGDCVPPSHPAGLTYGGLSACRMGTRVCLGAAGWSCQGGTGPSPEICDGLDNDCNGAVDDGAMPGLGGSCGLNTPPCSPGTITCTAGALTCQGGVTPGSEICNGRDDDCDGAVDELPLADGPSQPGCWADPGNCCSHQNASWCPPPGATCTGNGLLVAPCGQGALTCIGTAGWVCLGPRGPLPETCDGVDNDCNGLSDDGPLPGEGAACGNDIGECRPGVLDCVAGVLDCVGEVPPTAEVCNGLDDDCDGAVDDGLGLGAPCPATYDATLYPGPRTGPPCVAGQLVCAGGQLSCQGGLGPRPEICDGVDNDCDGSIDELGAAPDGVDGTSNPVPPPEATLGESCGESVGQCRGGDWACLDGQFACAGATTARPELCDCADNDCDGQVDEAPAQGEPAFCSAGKECVRTDGYCVCAPRCGSGEYPCPTGQNCLMATVSGTTTDGNYCIPEYCPDCAAETVSSGDGHVLCAPAGSDAPGCTLTPGCDCRGPLGCQAPCSGVLCDGDAVCSNFGPTPGECVEDICYRTGCPGCSRACHDGDCVNNPCTPGLCAPAEACKPSDDFLSYRCVDSCAATSCGESERCVDGTCVVACSPPCAPDYRCQLDGVDGPSCVPDKCLDQGEAKECADGSCCAPATGICGDCPCEGVICPAEQQCVDDECWWSDAGGGGAGAGGAAGAGGTGGTGGAGGAGGTQVGGGGDDLRVWRLSTGGGGCMCRIGPSGSSASFGGASALLALLLLRRRRDCRTR